MSFVAEYQGGNFRSLKKFFNRETPSPLVICSDGKTIVSGELFDKTPNDISFLGWEEKPEILNDLYGHVVVAKVYDNECWLVSDRNNLDTFYYYFNGSSFIISDDFWDIVRCIEPTFNDLDEEFVRRAVFMGGTIDGSTLIKGISVLMPNEIIHYDAASNTLNKRKYEEFCFTREITSIKTAAERLDVVFHNVMENLKDRFGDVIYGVGISGGLDSRIISHYCKKHEMRNVGFNFCVVKPHGIFEAESIKNARKIANIYNIPFYPIDWNMSSIDWKLDFAMRREVNFQGNAFKFEEKGIPEFDVLLTGGTGLLVGSMFPAHLKNMDMAQTSQEILSLFGNYGAVSFRNRASRALNYMFDTSIFHKSDVRSYLAGVLGGPEMYRKSLEEIGGFVSRVYSRGGNSVDAFGDYFINVVGFRNRKGAYESFFGTKRAFSIYMPFVYDEIRKWSFDLLADRSVLKYLIIDKIPEVSEIGTESFSVAPTGGGALKKMANMVEFLVRGNGSAIDQLYLKRKNSLKLFIESVSAHQNGWLYEFLKLPADGLSYEKIKAEPSRLIARMWELKSILSCLENKTYKGWR